VNRAPGRLKYTHILGPVKVSLILAYVELWTSLALLLVWQQKQPKLYLAQVAVIPRVLAETLPIHAPKNSRRCEWVVGVHMCIGRRRHDYV
jgi:hypothetical protein